jgi:hypothetical protein
LPNLPVQPVIIASQEEPGKFDFYRHFPWFLPVHRYDTPAQLLTELSDRVIAPSEAKVLEFRSTPSIPEADPHQAETAAGKKAQADGMPSETLLLIPRRETLPRPADDAGGCRRSLGRHRAQSARTDQPVR